MRLLAALAVQPSLRLEVVLEVVLAPLLALTVGQDTTQVAVEAQPTLRAAVVELVGLLLGLVTQEEQAVLAAVAVAVVEQV